MPGNEFAFSIIKFSILTKAFTIPWKAFKKIFPNASPIFRKLSIGALLSHRVSTACQPSIMLFTTIENTSATKLNACATNSTASSTVLNTTPSA
nr:ORF 11 [Haemophilus phage HP1]